MDVTALYPSVPQEEGLTCLESALDRRTDKTVPTAFLVKLMRLVLTMNTFVWDSKLFKQIMGTAIGTRSAPTFCGLFMGELEESMLQQWESLDKDCVPDEWWRFIDDCLFWWSGTPGELLIFINFVNTIHPDIKFTSEYNFQTRSVVFMDLVIQVDEHGYIQTDIHTKPNSKNTYLLPQSNHPSHICSNIPYSLAYRVKRNCSKAELVEQRLDELKEKLVLRSYRPKMIDNAFEKIRSLDRTTALAKVVRVNENEGRVRAMFRFDMRLPNLSGIFRKNWQLMVAEDVRLKSVFPRPPMVCYTRGDNIRDSLCTAKLPLARARMRETEEGFKRCGKPSCRLCPFTGLRPGEVQNSIFVSSTGRSFVSGAG